MFSGIVQQVGRIVQIERRGSGRRLVIRASRIPHYVKKGSSVSVSGVCLTLVEKHSSTMKFDVMKETLKKTTLEKKNTGDSVNLEYSLRAGDEIGGHFVYGHIDLMVKLKTQNSKLKTFELPREIKKYVFSEGSVTIDGVSLTIADVGKDYFSVALVPHTLSHTTLKNLRRGDDVNIECDMLAKYCIS